MRKCPVEAFFLSQSQTSSSFSHLIGVNVLFPEYGIFKIFTLKESETFFYGQALFWWGSVIWIRFWFLEEHL